MYKKKKAVRKKHRKSQLRVKAKIQESLLKAKPKPKKVVEPQVESVKTEEVKAPAKKAVAKKAPAKKAVAKKAPAKKTVAKK